MVLLALSQLAARQWRTSIAAARILLPDWAPWAGAVLLPAGFAAQLAVVAYAARFDRFGDHRWLARLPMHLAYFGPAAHSSAHAMVEAGIVGAVALQMLGLIAIAFGPERRTTRLAPLLTGIVLFVLATSATVLTSADVFYYAYASTVGLAMYWNSSVPVDSPYHALLPYVALTGDIYGPLWTQLIVAVGSFGSGLHDKIIAIRIVNVAFLLAAAAAIRLLRFPRRVQLAFALNPMIWFYDVVNAHNDIMTISLCLLAIAVVRRFPGLAIVLVAAAGAIKISYLLIGCIAFARLRARGRVVIATVLAGLASLLISWLLGGSAYFMNLLSYAQNVAARPDLNEAFFKNVSLTMSLVVLGLTVAAMLGRRLVAPAPWTYPLAAPLPYAWYLIWGVPYAALRRRGFATVLLLLPIGAALSDYVFGMQTAASILMITLVVTVAAGVVRSDFRRRFGTKPA